MQRRRLTAAVVATAAALSWFAWESDSIGLKDRFIEKRYAEVEAGALDRSGQLSRHLIAEALARHRIAVVVDLTEAIGSADQLAEEAACRAAGIEHLRFPLAGDGTGAVEHYAGAIAAIAKAHAMGQKVLVHCSSGSRRAGGVIAAYFLWVEREGERKSAAEARAEIERVDGDDATSERLITFLDENAAAIGARLTELGVTIRAPTPKLGH